ncbi:MAG: AAA family ATPase, partial [Candidatus Dormibacteraceae bacterium]
RSVIEGVPFLGFETRKGPVVYLTEERRPSVLAALGRAALAGTRDLHVLTFSQSRGAAWAQVVAAAIAQAEQVGADLLVVDTLHRWAGISGDSENESGAAVVAMQPLHAAAAAGLAVLVDRHERKSGGEVGTAARGSSAYTGEVDIAGSLRRWPGGRPNLRELRMVGRFDDVPERLLFELDALSGSYQLADGAELERERLLGVIPASAAEAATEPEISQRLGRIRTTVRDHLVALLEAGAIHRAGGGKRGDPYRYWRPRKLSDGPIGMVTASETQPLLLEAKPVQPNGKHPVGVSR